MYGPRTHLDSSIDIDGHRTTKNNKCNYAKADLNLVVTVFRLIKQNMFATSFSVNVLKRTGERRRGARIYADTSAATTTRRAVVVVVVVIAGVFPPAAPLAACSRLARLKSRR